MENQGNQDRFDSLHDQSKTCANCLVPKNPSEFYLKDKKSGRLASKCKECEGQDRADYYQQNKDTVSSYHKKYYGENKDKVINTVVLWQKKNPEKRRLYARRTNARLRQENPQLLTDRRRKKEKSFLSNPANRLAKNLRTRLRRVLKGKTRKGSAVTDLGCSVEHLRNHIESLWQEGMSWDNYGKDLGTWNLDHIIPLTAYDLSDRQHVILACHYLNLQPLWHVDNTSKGDRYPINA